MQIRQPHVLARAILLRYSLKCLLPTISDAAAWRASVIRIMPAVIFRIATLADVQTRCGRLHPTFVKVQLSPSRNNPSPLSEITPDPKSTGAQHPKSLNTRPGFHHHRIGAGYPVSI